MSTRPTRYHKRKENKKMTERKEAKEGERRGTGEQRGGCITDGNHHLTGFSITMETRLWVWLSCFQRVYLDRA